MDKENKELKTALAARVLMAGLTSTTTGGNIPTMSTVRKIFKHICRRCDHVWHSYVKEPKKCPDCQSRKWAVAR